MRVRAVFLLLNLAVLEGASMQTPSWESLRHQVSNQEVEMRAFERRLENFHTMLEGVQEEIQASSSLYKNQIKDQTIALEVRVNALENLAKGLTADLQQLKTHANETTATFQAFKKTLIDFEQRFKTQNQSIENLTAALNSVVEVFQGPKEAKLYKIKSGDSLDKIAKANGTTVKELMRINNMNGSDKIVVGKTLKLTE